MNSERVALALVAAGVGALTGLVVFLLLVSVVASAKGGAL